MPKESNYFEEAYRLCQDRDPLVSITCKSLYDIMLKARLDDGLTPSGDFNILYFFQSAIRLLSERFPAVDLDPSVFPCLVEPIRACDWPDESRAPTSPEREESSLITHYMELVAADSTPCGDGFDLCYACSMISLMLHEKPDVIAAWEGHDSSSHKTGDTVDFDFDHWLSGFTCDLVERDQTPEGTDEGEGVFP